MKVDDVDIELLKRKLAHTRIGFKLDEVDMVCIFFPFLSSDYVMITMLQTIFFCPCPHTLLQGYDSCMQWSTLVVACCKH
jgi:hypothetical protein